MPDRNIMCTVVVIILMYLCIVIVGSRPVLRFEVYISALMGRPACNRASIQYHRLSQTLDSTAPI